MDWVEGWHNHLKRIVEKAHPNKFVFIECIQQEQMATEMFILQLGTGSRAPHGSIQAITRDNKINGLKRRFTSNSIALDEHIHTWTILSYKPLI